jgi:hypothetical protein
MNQSFNTENFLKIFYNENRKGNYLEKKFPQFHEAKTISKQILDINSQFKEKKKELISSTITKEDYELFKIEMNTKKEILQKQKHNKIEMQLNKITEKISKHEYSLEINDDLKIDGKTVYTVDKTSPETFFILKKLQSNIQHTFKVKQSDRNEIIHQVKNLLDNAFPKFVIRTDIKSFFESIPHDKLLKKVKKNPILNSQSKKIIKQVFREYRSKTGLDKGVPRGIGISAYLSELYMRDIDNKIKYLPNVTYYARYVDDIIVIFTPNTKYDDLNYIDKIKDIIAFEDLEINEGKTKQFDLITEEVTENFDFLGYKITFNNLKNKPIEIDLTNNKKNKYKAKLDKSFEIYNTQSKYNEKKARKILVKRLRYLTENTRLLNVKKEIMIGIYFSNILLTKTSSLNGLDRYLEYKINTISPYENLTHLNIDRLKDRLRKFSFKEGFNEQKFCKFTTHDFKTILEPWKEI